MPRFRYTARTATGQVTEGMLEAETASLAARSLREQGLWVTQLRPEREPTPSPAPVVAGSGIGSYLAYLWSGIRARELAIFYRQLHALYHSGIALPRAMAMVADALPNRQLRKISRALAADLGSGIPLHRAIERFPWVFNELQRHTLAAGEQGGVLEAVLLRLADYFEREWQLRLELRSRLLYPFLLLLAFIFIPPLPVLVLQGFGAYFRQIAAMWGPPFLAIVAVAVTGRYLMRYPAARYAWDTLKLATPGIADLVRKLASARFARALALLAHAGIYPHSALTAAADACGNEVIRRRVHRLAPEVARGAALTEVLGVTGFFPATFLGMVQTGEQAGGLDAMLDKVADYYEQEAAHAAKQRIVVLGVAALLVMALVIALRVIGFYTGMFGGLMQEME